MGVGSARSFVSTFDLILTVSGGGSQRAHGKQPHPACALLGASSIFNSWSLCKHSRGHAAMDCPYGPPVHSTVASMRETWP